MKIFMLLASLAILLSPAGNPAAAEKQRVFTLDEDVWVLFYDVPSRRFRRTRDAFVRRDWDSVSRDLAVSAGFVHAEADRSSAALVEPLNTVAQRMDEIAETIHSSQISGSDLDALFARVHWLLAQHYLEQSITSRDALDSRNAGAYLWATVHHMERTVLWSNARLTRRQLESLETLRDLAGRLRDAADPAPVYKERPIVLAKKTLLELGAHMDRKIWLDPL